MASLNRQVEHRSPLRALAISPVTMPMGVISEFILQEYCRESCC